jgi:hypothetical protein
MSAFLCTDLHTVAVAAYGSLKLNLGLAETAIALRALNNAALRARYNDEAVPLAASFKETLAAAAAWLYDASAADIDGLARCLRYQCSEGDCDSQPGWKTLAAICEASHAAAAGAESGVWSI